MAPSARPPCAGGRPGGPPKSWGIGSEVEAKGLCPDNHFAAQGCLLTLPPDFGSNVHPPGAASSPATSGRSWNLWFICLRRPSPSALPEIVGRLVRPPIMRNETMFTLFSKVFRRTPVLFALPATIHEGIQVCSEAV
jgi:hypothetical protein